MVTYAYTTLDNTFLTAIDDPGQIVGWYRDGLGVDANSNDSTVSVLLNNPPLAACGGGSRRSGRTSTTSSPPVDNCGRIDFDQRTLAIMRESSTMVEAGRNHPIVAQEDSDRGLHVSLISRAGFEASPDRTPNSTAI